jgi:hypothetical protein
MKEPVTAVFYGSKTFCCKTAQLSETPRESVYNINLVLTQLGVIEIVRVGDQRPSGKASEFRYLRSQSENGAEGDDADRDNRAPRVKHSARHCTNASRRIRVRHFKWFRMSEIEAQSGSKSLSSRAAIRQFG